MRKILVVSTGGTIGSKVQNSTIDVHGTTNYFLIQLYSEQYKAEVEFQTVQPIHILSENFTPQYWHKLCRAIQQYDLEQYAGVIVTHGTDTLPYTSAILGFLLRHVKVPVVIIGSNYALQCENSNGLANFKSSVDFILNSGLRGVYCIYQNNKGGNVVYLSSRIQEADSYNDQFCSFGGEHLGEIVDGRFVYNDSKTNPSIRELNSVREQLLDEEILFNNQIFAIRPYPGLDYDFFNFNKKPRAILHSLYHSGTGCISDDSYSLSAFVRKCVDDGMDFYLTSFKNINSDLYKTSREILDHGAVPLQNISFEAALSKLVIAYNQTADTPQDFMKKELFFEFLPN